MQQPWVSIVIPCFNEEGGLRETATSVLSFTAQRVAGKPFELVLINDGSTDSTGDIMKALAQENPPVRPIYFETNRGRGAAIKAGIAQSRGQFVILLDADLSYDVQHVGEILNVFEKDSKADVVVVSPYMKGGIVRGVPFKRLFVSRMANWILSGFISNSLSTVTCVVRGYRGDKIRKLHLFEEGKELHLEILRKLDLSGAQITEIPGRLVWKSTKKNPRRANNLDLIHSAKRHLKMGLLFKPTRPLKFFAIFLIFIGLYETFNVARGFFRYYESNPEFWRGVWQAIYRVFEYSPHTVVIASVSLILGLQTLSFLALLQAMTLQHEESLRHLIALLEKRDS